MNRATTYKKIISLFIAVLYFFFSCFYVTRCAKIVPPAGKNVQIILGKQGKTTLQCTISNYNNSKQIPFAFLSRPRVIFCKSIVSFAAPFVKFTENASFILHSQLVVKVPFLSFKVVHSNNIFSFIRAWRI
jgi:hypothetical protein